MDANPAAETRFGSRFETRFETDSPTSAIGMLSTQTVPLKPPVSRVLHRGYGSVLRRVYRATHARDHWHNERLWPLTKVDRDADGRLQNIRLGRRSITLENAAYSQTVQAPHPRAIAHLIACGPSVADIDYSAFAMNNVMGVNGAIALAERQPVKFTHYCVTDTGFLRNRPELVARILAQDLLFFTTPTALWHILHHFDYDKIKCRFFLMERVGEQALRCKESPASAIAHANGDLALFDETEGLGFSHDIRRAVFPGGTVAYEALQILNWLGYQHMYMHGVDLGNADSCPRFYENANDTLPSFLTQQLRRVIEPSFRQAGKLLRAKGVHVINLSTRSALGSDIFPIGDWRSLIVSRSKATA